jgi:DNA primase
MDEREEVRQKVDLVELVSEYVQLKKAGRNWSGLCPFHGEKTPSFMVSPELGIYKCFGCNKGGDAFSFLMEIEGIGFGEALKILADRVGVKLRRWRPSGEEAEREKLLRINRLAADWYKFLLTRHGVGKKGLDYLLGRGVSREAIVKFELGWAPEGWEGMLRFLVEKKGFKATEVEKSGLVITGKRGGYYDRFRGRVMFPLKNSRGEVVGFAGRVLPRANADEGAKYINTPETVLYHKSELLYGLEVTKEEIRRKNRVVVVEGELDMMSSWQVGVKEVVAIKGSALTEIQVKRLSRLAEKLILALDMDAAGDQAARRGWRVAEAAGMEVRVVRIPQGKDPDEMARADAEGWRRVVDEAVEVYEFLVESALERYDKKTAFGKRKIAGELLPIWAGVGDEVAKAHWVKRLAGVLEIEEKAVWREIQKPEARSRKSGARIKNQESRIRENDGLNGGGPLSLKLQRGKREEVEKYLLALVLQGKPKVVTERGFLKLLKSEWARRLGKLLRDYFEKEKEFKAVKFQKSVPEELKGLVGELWMREVEKVRDPEWWDKELGRVEGRLKVMNLKEEMAEVKKGLAEAEKGGDEEKAEKLRGEFGKLSRKLKELV